MRVACSTTARCISFCHLIILKSLIKLFPFFICVFVVILEPVHIQKAKFVRFGCDTTIRDKGLQPLALGRMVRLL